MNELKIVEGKELLTVQQTADYLQIPKSTVYQWTMRKILPVCKLAGGNLSRYRKSDLVNFVNQHMQGQGVA